MKKILDQKIENFGQKFKNSTKFWSFSIIFYGRISYLFLIKTIFLVTLNTFETSWDQKNFENSKNFNFFEKFQKLSIFWGKKTRKNFFGKIF